MKRIKKLASLFLAMVMVLSMGLTVFATGATPPTDQTPVGDTKADDPDNGHFSITITDTAEGYTYRAYQIFKGDLSKAENGSKTLSNIQWGDGVNVTEINKLDYFQKEVKDEEGNTVKVPMTAAEVAKKLAGDATTNDFDTEKAIEFAAIIGDYLNEDAAIPESAGHVIDNLDAGYYLVENAKINGTDGGSETRYMMEVVGNVTATPKRGTLEHDKYIEVEKPEGTEGVDYFKVNNAPIGGTVKYNIPVKLPENLADYESYYLEFSDVLSKGLILKKDDGSIPTAADYKVKVQVVTGDILKGMSVADKDNVAAVMSGMTAENTKDVTTSFKTKVSTYAGTEKDKEGGHHIQVWMHDLLELNPEAAEGQPAQAPVVAGGSWVILTYETTLNTDALIGLANPNYVAIKYSNNPNDSGKGTPDDPNEPDPKNPTGETPDKKVDTYTTELALTKTDEAGHILAGAEFKLTGPTGAKITVVKSEEFKEDENGLYWKLKDDTYTMTSPDTEGINKDAYAVPTTTKYARVSKEFTDLVGVNGSVTVAVGDDGRIIFTGLAAGKYTLSEEVVPAGFNKCDDVTFTIVFNDGTFTLAPEDADKGITLGGNMFDTMIVNTSGSLLPSTGGIGTTIFYVVGGILVVAAGILLVTKKRMSVR